MGKVTWPSLNSRRVAARPIMPRRRSGVLHRSIAVLLSEKGNGRLQKRLNFPLVSSNAWHVDISSIPTKPPASTSAPIPKWFAYQRRLHRRRHHIPPSLPYLTSRLPPPAPLAPTAPIHSSIPPVVTADLQDLFFITCPQYFKCIKACPSVIPGIHIPVGFRVTLLGHFSFLLPLIPVPLLHLSHACVALRPLGLASSFLGSLYFYLLGVDSLSWP